MNEYWWHYYNNNVLVRACGYIKKTCTPKNVFIIINSRSSPHGPRTTIIMCVFIHGLTPKRRRNRVTVPLRPNRTHIRSVYTRAHFFFYAV